MARGEEGAGEVPDGGYDDGEVVAAVPEAVVGCLVAKYLCARDQTAQLLERGEERSVSVPASDRRRWRGRGSTKVMLDMIKR